MDLKLNFPRSLKKKKEKPSQVTIQEFSSHHSTVKEWPLTGCVAIETQLEKEATYPGEPQPPDAVTPITMDCPVSSVVRQVTAEQFLTKLLSDIRH